MQSHTLLRVLFILYCVEAGSFLILAPWSPFWDRIVLQLPFPILVLYGLHPILRGGVSGFGLVHLVWGAHDLDVLIARWRSRGATPSPLARRD